MTKTNPTVLVVDFGAQYAQLIARRVREANVYSEIVSNDLTAKEVAGLHPAGIIFSGGPKSVRIDGAPQIDPAIYELDIPILGICYGAQLIAQQLEVPSANSKQENMEERLCRSREGASLTANLQNRMFG